MRKAAWFARWSSDENEEAKEDNYDGPRGTSGGVRGKWRWRRGSSEGRWRGLTEHSAERQTAPLSHALF